MATLTRELAITNQRGLHARASAKFVKCAEGFDANVTVSRDGQTVPGTSIMGLMMLAASIGSSITASGTHAFKARSLARIGDSHSEAALDHLAHRGCHHAHARPALAATGEGRR